MAESAERPSKSWANAILWSLVILLAIPPFYLLSLGPVVGMAKRGWISQTVADAYATPVWMSVNPRGWFAHMLE